MFALGAEASDDKEKYLNLGAEISRTCHESYDRSGKTKSFWKGDQLYVGYVTSHKRGQVKPKFFCMEELKCMYLGYVKSQDR